MIHISYEEAFTKMASEAYKEVVDNSIVGVGSGSAVAEFVEHLGDRVKRDDLRITIVPSSLQIQIIAEEADLMIGGDHLIPMIDLAVDGADQIDRSYNMIKGGGGALFKEKVILSSSKKSLILADETKYVDILNKAVPIEVSPFARRVVYKKLIRLGGRPRVRLLNKGYPYITENGNLILDTDFGPIREPKHLEDQLKSIPGVVEVGIFTVKINIFYKGMKEGAVQKIVTSEK